MASKSAINGFVTHQEPLAIVGIGLRLPMKSNNPQEFWNHLLDAKNGVTKVPRDRWNADYFTDKDSRSSGKMVCNSGAFIDNVKAFDNEFFNMTSYQSMETDPQIRLLLEVTFEAMEDAGLRLDDISNTKTSVFVSSFHHDYLTICSQNSARDNIGPSMGTGFSSCSLSNRISYQFNLKGPSMTIDTACSGSLVAIHHACQSIWNGEADMAIVGGSGAILRPECSIVLSRGGFLSPTGSCKAFDSSADGYVRGEGVAVIMIKPLQAALQNQDRIYALIRGTATNHDGYKEQGYSVPSAAAQASLLTSLYQKVGIAPNEVDYVECHGTGTVVGDPQEAEALKQVIGKNRDHQCYIGSVKTNIGHLEGAAGIVGLIKAALILKHKTIPPNLHYHQPRAELRLHESNFVVPTQVTRCKTKPNGKPLLAGVNSFGAGGANAHAILSEFIPQQTDTTKMVNGHMNFNTICLLFLISDESDSRLLSTAKTYLEYLKQTSHDISDICYTLLQRRSILSKQLLITGYSKEEIIDLLEQFIQGKQHSQILKRQSSSLRNKHYDQSINKLAFVYSGQGGQWMGMCRKLITEMPVFKSKMMEIDEKFQTIAGWSLINELDCIDASTSKINDTKVVQPLIMAVQIALTHVWRQFFGVEPDGFVGHSVGEIAAAHCSGVIDLETAVFIIYHRSAIQNRLTNKGKMLALGMNESEVKELLTHYADQVSIAAMNGPRMTVVAGDGDILSKIAADCEAKQIFQAFVKTQIPYHTSIMEEIKDELLAQFQHVKSKRSQGDLYSTVTATKKSDLNGKYWFENVRQPVLFVQTIEKMINDGYQQFIEIGPHPVLIAGIKQLQEQMNVYNGLTISSIKRQHETTQLFQNLGVYWLHNSTRGNVAFTKVFPGAHFMFDLPRYSWQHKDFWFETSDEQQERLVFKYNGGHPFLRQDQRFFSLDSHQIWRANINVTSALYLADHVANDVILFPAVGYIELAYGIGNLQEQKKSLHGSEQPKCFVEEITFESAIILSEDRMQLVDTQIEVTSSEGHFVVYTKLQHSDDPKWTRHASGKINTLDRFKVQKQPKLADVMSSFQDHHLVDVKEFYSFVSESGLTFGEQFQCIEQLWYKNAAILSKASLSEHLIGEADKYNIHPALFDAAIHGLFAEHMKNGINQLYLPHSIDRGIIYEKGTHTVYAYIEVLRSDDEVLQTNTWIYNETGGLVAEFYGLTAKNLSGISAVKSQDAVFEHRWMPKALASPLETPATVDDTKLKPSQLILVVDDLSNDLAKQLSVKLSSAHSKHAFNRIDLIDDEDELKEKIMTDDQSMAFVVYIPSLCQRNNETSEMQEKAWKFLKLIQLVVSWNEQRHMELRLITHQSTDFWDQLGDDKMKSNRDGIQMDHALLCGMCRVVENECPNMMVKFIDVDSHALDCLDSICDDLLDTQLDVHEREIMYRHSMRYVRRLMQCDHEQIKQSQTKQLSGVGSYYELEIQERGLLDSIVFRQKVPKQLNSDEIEIEIHAAGINLKDVMNAMGQLSKKSVAGSSAGNSLGLEVSGIVVNKGDDVKGFDIGDAVIGLLANSFSGRATTAYTNCTKKPSSISHVEAVTIPVVYSTAYFCLIHLARMTKEDTILIHSAAGGVGIACINLAKYIGANIIATVGSKVKREFLEKECGVNPEFIFDSRSTTFYDDVMRVTNQQGVDIVMNSLSGVLLTQSIKCLKPFGRFIEIGKTDIYQNKLLCLERFGDNISYFAFDLDRLSFQKPLLFWKVICELETLFEKGHIKPLPSTVYSINDISAAFRSLMSGQTIGKLVVNMEDQVVTALPPQCLNFSKEGAFIITGGTRGLGLRMAQWISQRGMHKLVLVSRNGIQSSEDQVFVDQLRSNNKVEVAVRQMDIRSMEEVEKLFVEVHERFGPIRGIIHSAAILRDGPIDKMDRDSFLTVIQTKAMGAWNLHHASLNYTETIEHFILFSSISSTIGNAGQINYAASNYFLDTLAEYRHEQRLPCTSVNLGLLGEYAGMSATRDTKASVSKVLQTFGIQTMPLFTVQHQLEMAILQRSPSRVTASLDWMSLKQALPIIKNDARFVDIIEKQGTTNKSNSHAILKDRLVALANVNDAVELLTKEISMMIGKISGLSGQSIDLDQSLGKIGFDSLGYTQLRNWLVKTVEINYPIIQLIKVPSIQVLVVEIIKNVTKSNPGESQQKPLMKDANSVITSPFNGASLPLLPPVKNTDGTHTSPVTEQVVAVECPKKVTSVDLLSLSTNEKENMHMNQNDYSSQYAEMRTSTNQDESSTSILDSSLGCSKASECVYILGIGTANPPICNKTEEVWKNLKLEYQRLGVTEMELKKIENLYENSGIEQKYCHADFTKKTFTENAHESFHEKFSNMAPDLALAAAKRAIEDWGGNVKAITHIITSTSTGILLPDLHCLLMKSLNLKNSIERASSNMMACIGGLTALKAAKAFALQNPKYRILMVCVDMFSIHYKPTLHIEEISSFLRLGDGSAAMIIGCEPQKQELSIYEIIHTGSEFLPDTEDLISWTLTPHGQIFRSDPLVPTIVTQNVPNMINSFLKSCPSNVSVKDCDWLVHPAGVNILLKLQAAMNISVNQMRSSWKILQNYGNMSGATIIFVIDDARKHRKEADLNICFAVGPGVTVEIALLRRL